METWVDSQAVYEGRIISVRTGQVRLDDGTLAPREIVEHPGGVGIVPVLGNTVLLVRQFRIALGRDILEIPAGRLEPGEDPLARAQAELEEETGYRAQEWTKVSVCYPSCGISNQVDYIYIAQGLTEVGQNLEFDERIELVRIPLADLETRLNRLEFDDAKTIIGLRELLARHPHLVHA